MQHATHVRQSWNSPAVGDFVLGRGFEARLRQRSWRLIVLVARIVHADVAAAWRRPKQESVCLAAHVCSLAGFIFLPFRMAELACWEERHAAFN